MRSLALALVLVAAATLVPVDAAFAQSTARLRGTITAVDGSVMAVKTRDGRDVKLALADNVTVAVAKAARFEDLKAGDFVGATTTPGPDGTPVVVEVHYLAPTTAEGQTPSDLMPNATMTNANVTGASVVDGKREITLQFKGATQKVVVPDGAAIVRTVPGTRADLVAGEYVFLVAQVGADGTMTVPRVQVSKDGVRPPQ